MLDQNDFKALREMFGEMLHGELSDFRIEMRDEMRAMIRASEHRIIGEITDFIASAILPQIDDHDVRIARLEKRIA